MGDPKHTDLRYVLSLEDDLNWYTWLFSSAIPDDKAATGGLFRYLYLHFRAMVLIAPDRVLLFVPEVVKELPWGGAIYHHLTPAFCPWATVTVERLCKEVLRAVKTVLSELQLSPE